jgi:hypothetical protein
MDAILLACGSAALFGASTPLAKLLLGQIDPWLMAGILYLGSGCGLLLYRVVLGALGSIAPEAPLRRADLPWLGAAVLCGTTALGLIRERRRVIGVATSRGPFYAPLVFLGKIEPMKGVHEAIAIATNAGEPSENKEIVRLDRVSCEKC